MIARRTAILIVLTLTLISCMTTTTPQSVRLDNKVDIQLECVTAYRSSVRVPLEKQERLSLSSANQAAVFTYTDLVFNAMYSPGGYDIPSLKVWVTPADSTDELYATLFQFSPITPTTRAELQFWCSTQ